MVPEDADVEPETAEECYMVTICQLRDSFGSKSTKELQTPYHRPKASDGNKSSSPSTRKA